MAHEYEFFERLDGWVLAELAPFQPHNLARIFLNATRQTKTVIRKEALACVKTTQPTYLYKTLRASFRAGLRKDGSVLRLYLSTGRGRNKVGAYKNYYFTGRPTQPWVPLTYWMEHGISANRKHRGPDKKPRQKRGLGTKPPRGDMGDWRGRHALQMLPTVSDERIDEIMTEKIEEQITKIWAKYGY